MRKPNILMISVGVMLLFVGCNSSENKDDAAQNTHTFTIENPTSVNRTAATFTIVVNDIFDKTEGVEWSKIGFVAEENLAFQLIDEDADGTPETVLISTDLNAGESRKITVTFNDENANQTFVKRTQAEISHKVGGEWKDKVYIGGTFKNVQTFKAPEQNTDHSEYIRYEGPGWESDKVAYRSYLDWRNAVDIFGKKTSEMSLQKVGLDGYDSYHEASDWGMDVLKVAKSLGIGSIGFWGDGVATRVEKTSPLECTIVENGILQSKIKTQYNNWEINGQTLNLTSNLSIQAGSRLTLEAITLSENLPNICTGIVKLEKGELIQQAPASANEWGYLATYGSQSLAEDNLGMVVFFKGSDFIEFQADENSHVVVLKPIDNQVSYYFGAAWEQELDGIKTMDEFKKYLADMVTILNNEVIVNVK